MNPQPVARLVSDVSGAYPPGTLEPYIRVAGLTKTFGEFHALRDISLAVYPGEFVCLLGPSGCGKTTLLRAIAGLEPQTKGEIYLGGKDVSRLAPARRDFGIVFQSYALFPNLTVENNVAYGLVARGDARTEVGSRVAELLDLVGLRSEGKKYPSQLSGGQQQRVALARALATSPSLLLLDEPLSALDAQVRVYLRDEIRALQKRIGITTILVTHDQEEALAIADRVFLMRGGQVEQVGTPRDIYESPSTEFVMRFVGTSSPLSGKQLADGKILTRGGVELATKVRPAIAPGTAVVAYVRPEDVKMVTEDVVDNCLNARVESTTFKGSHWRVVVRTTAGDVSLLADISAAELARRPYVEGEVCRVQLPADALRVFAAV